MNELNRPSSKGTKLLFHVIEATINQLGPGLCEFLVGTFQLPGSQKTCISFGLLKVEIGKIES